MRSFFAAVLLFTAEALAAGTCYYRDGSVADGYNPCPSSNYCCRPTDTCVTTGLTGLCQDINNHYPNDTLTNPLGGSTFYNQTNLYQTTSCTNKDFSGCGKDCTIPSSSDMSYVWACNDALTSYCCHNTSISIFEQMECCTGPTLFALPSPVVDLVSTSSTASPRSTSTPPATSSTTSASTTGTANPAATSGSAAAAALVGPGGLTSGATIGIGVGVGVGVLFLIVVAILFWRVKSLQTLLRKKPVTAGAARESTALAGSDPAPPYHDVEYFAAAPAKPASTTRVEPVEVDTGRQFHEMAERNRDPHELP